MDVKCPLGDWKPMWGEDVLRAPVCHAVPPDPCLLAPFLSCSIWNLFGAGGGVIRFIYYFLMDVPGIEARTLCTLTTHSATELRLPCFMLES